MTVRSSELLLWFMDEMADGLAANAHKGDTWCDMKPSWLLRRLDAEVNELKRAVRHGDQVQIRREAADVANFAAFVADKTAGRP